MQVVQTVNTCVSRPIDEKKQAKWVGLLPAAESPYSFFIPYSDYVVVKYHVNMENGSY